MGRFNSPRQVQRFLATHDQINVIFRPNSHKSSAKSYRHSRTDAFILWDTYANEIKV